MNYMDFNTYYLNISQKNREGWMRFRKFGTTICMKGIYWRRVNQFKFCESARIREKTQHLYNFAKRKERRWGKQRVSPNWEFGCNLSKGWSAAGRLQSGGSKGLHSLSTRSHCYGGQGERERRTHVCVNSKSHLINCRL